VTDVTRLKRTEAALLRVERQLHAREHLVALGTLAAGIAHEINNPLAAVTANVELALEAIASPAVDLEQVTVELNDARSAATRLRDIVHSMKLLARGDVSHEEIVNVADVLDQSIAFSRATVRYRARVQRSHQGDARVKASSSQLVQVFVNLLTNAAQAIAPSASGLIQVRSWTEGNLVAIEVIDNGCGIPTELQTRVFEPFFTTKDVGVGMGLGLSISASIIRGLGGDIACTSEAGYGSTFRVTLPRSLAPSSTSFTSARVSLAGSADDSSIPILRARVLIVDDEPGVARILARILTKICEVVMTTNSVEACQLLLDNGQDYALIFCDLMMPEMNGDVLYHRVVAARPELAQRFVMMTGGAFTAEGRAFLDSVPAPVIDKPFDVKQIRDLVRRHCASG
jgi:CheY-like chemotaxis protein